MTQPQQPALIDTGNPLLSGGPARLDTGSVWAEGGGTQVGVVTVRTTSATVSVMLTRAQLRSWAGLLTSLADSFSESGLMVAAAADVPRPAAIDGRLG